MTTKICGESPSVRMAESQPIMRQSLPSRWRFMA